MTIRGAVLVGLVLALGAAGCGLGASRDAAGPAGGSGSNAPPCVVSIGASPTNPVAGSGTKLHLAANASPASPDLHYAWRVVFDGAVLAAPPDSAEIDVATPAPGIYAVSVSVSGASCTPGAMSINVAAPGALTQTLRLRIVPPRSVAAPAMEKLIPIKGGASADLGTIGVDAGVVTTAQVIAPGGGVPAYLQFSPSGAPDAIVEAFSDASGAASVQLVLAPYSVLVVPPDPATAPRRIAAWSPGAVLRLDAGSPITGAVRDPANAPLAGATVRLAIDGVPSTLATTAGDGSFALRAVTGGTATVEVTPPAGSGLPRLSATSPGFDLAAPLQIRYAANVARVDLAGTRLRHQGAAAGGARLTVVGSLAAVGTVTAGTQVVATGEVRITATADAGGVLPAMPVPAAALSAVIEASPGDLAVVALDTSGGVPATLDAPAGQLITTAAQDDRGAGLPGAVLELVPTGALAMAGAPTLRIAAAASGVIAAALPAGGRYELRFSDPMGRRAPLIVPDRTITAFASSYALPTPVAIHGTLRLDGTQPLANASVQILCQACTGTERTRPLLEVTSDAAGQFTLAVPDPGTR